MAWNAGAEFTMMEKSVRAEWSGTRSFPPYGTGNTHNTWYACSMVDAKGREIPWADRDGNILSEVSERYRPAAGQRLYLKGGCDPDIPSYDYRGPDILPVEKLLEQGYELPFYADLASMPEHERRAIWGLMVGEEGKTKIPILRNYTGAGFDPDKDLLQSYGEGWQSAAFHPNERQLFGFPGGIVNDWQLRTNIEGLYAAGDQLFASNCHGHAAATGHYAGRHAASNATDAASPGINEKQVQRERARVLSLVCGGGEKTWKDVNSAIAGVMRQHCGAIKDDESLESGLNVLDELRRRDIPRLQARNPHELVRSLEVLNVLSNAELVVHACLARKAGARHLLFERSDFPEVDPPDWHKFVTVRLEAGKVMAGELSIDYYGDLDKGYTAHNGDYVAEDGL